jgi:hypothetical protein
MIKRFRQYLIDSYNGLYKIVLQPSMPSRGTIILLVVGLILGMFAAYALYPVQYYDGSPSQLSRGYRDQWIKLVAASYASGTYADQDVISLLQQVENPGAAVQNLLQTATGAEQRNLQKVLPLAQAAGAGVKAPSSGSIISSLMNFLIPIILIVVITPILVLIWRLLFYPNIVAPLWDKLRPKSEEELQKRKELQVEKQARLAAIEAQKNLVVEVDEVLGEPTIQKLSVYTKGRQFDDSFAIEDANDAFLGECGASVAKALGASNELAAVEVWLFDKEDFVRTLTKVFVSEYGYNDPAIRSELEPKVENPATDIIVVSEGARLILETDALRMQATVKSFSYGASALPPNSVFESINVEITVWQKQGAAAGMPVTAAPMAANAPAAPLPTFDQQPTQPTSTSFSPLPSASPNYGPSPSPYSAPPSPSPSPSPGFRPLSPPPMQPRPVQPPAPMSKPEDDDDDPFGGTGDFTPLTNT